MRVWTLASWGGLLALTACSGSDQAGPLSTQPTAPEDPVSTPLSATEASRNLRRDTATAQALAEPETQLNRPQVSRSSRAKTPTLSPPTSARPATPPSSAQQLRARVQQIRQQRTNAVPSPPSRLNQPSLTAVQPVPQPPRPESVAATPTSPAPTTVTAPQPVVTTLPTPHRPQEGPLHGGNQRFTPAEAVPPLAPQPSAAASPAPQEQPEVTRLDSASPVPAAPHQGYSATRPVLTPLSASTAEGRELAGLRLHGRPSPSTEPEAAATDGVGQEPEAGFVRLSLDTPLPDSIRLAGEWPGPEASSADEGDSANSDSGEPVVSEPVSPVTEEVEPAAIAPTTPPEVQGQAADSAAASVSSPTAVVPSLNGDHPTPESGVDQGSPQFSNHLRFDSNRFDPEHFDLGTKTRPAFSKAKPTPTSEPSTRSREATPGHQSHGPIRLTAQQACFPSANQHQTRDEASSIPLATRVARLQQKHRQGDAHRGDRCATFLVTTDEAAAQGEAP
ncbi:hypothetical protein [Nodosilinea sp. P-1105]|uniref:hypothetical protein n=1 Tax=Nodosilinea sp. P-1105 TaxID=2546229 RepID=UPI00146C62FE|nr:hypothetical protein [Nodosilinea sp. P-1105]NMF82462.1 hypothetical protein [Nodosilinea sp. P-1105]